jgi:26S proteasome regulatory subunit N2
MNICRCWIFLGDTTATAGLITSLLEGGKIAMAYQVCFDLYSAATQQFLGAVKSAIAASAEISTADPKVAADVLGRIASILSGNYTLEVTKEFLSLNNNADELLLTTTKDALPANSVYHGALVMSNALMYAGTTQHPFLTKNVEWLRRSQNWAKFSSVASLGVVHKGHTAHAMSVLGPYLPGKETSAYLNGGAFFALGLIYANHANDATIDYLIEQLNVKGGERETEVMNHGCCLGLGLAGMGTGREDLYGMLKNKLEFESAVIGEAASIAMGLVKLGSADVETFDFMVTQASQTQHEKIIRGIAVGAALIFYGRQAQANVQIHALCADKDHMMRMAGCHTIATAYAGTNDNAMIKILLHIAVSDVNDDVRRSAVTSIGFVLCRNHEQLPSTVMLLSESFNPHVRYGTMMALGIACAGTGSAEALALVEPLVEDPVGYVRQGAFIALAMIMMQQPMSHPKAKWTRDQFTKVIGDKHQEILAKFGAIYAQGILEAGGRNCTLKIVTEEGHLRMQGVVGMLIFTQFWFWFPLGHCLSLALTPTAVVCMNTDLKMPKNLKLRSNAPPSKFAPPPMTEVKKKEAKEKVETVVLSTSNKAKAKALAKDKEEKEKEGSGAAMDVDGAKEGAEGVAAAGDEEAAAAAAAAAAAEKKKKDEPEATFEMLSNPARVVIPQLTVVSFEADGRYQPVVPGPIRSGIVIMTDATPDEPEEFIEIAAAAEVVKVGEADLPPPFAFDAKLEDE